jgi:alkanesulfonate monooxygenase SsuD/methylene tetrahydromethanopterin reductase-like flavin-dependent oxidoreductase (luciferase family)
MGGAAGGVQRKVNMRFGLVYSIEGGAGDHAGQVFRDALEEILLAESFGLDSVFISEHHFVSNGFFPSPLIALSYLAAKTSKIKFGPGVLLLPLYDPIHVAEDCAVLDIISNGRLILGVGQGYRPEEFSSFGVELRDRPVLLREGVNLIRRLWTEPTVTFHGKHFKAEQLPLRPQPVQKPAPPIWIAAKKRKAVELAGEVGDGWFADPITPLSIIRDHRPHWEQAVRKAGGDPKQKSFAYYREFLVADDDASAWRLGREPMMEAYRNYLRWGHLVDDEGRTIPPENEGMLESLVRKRFTLGGPRHCVDEIQMLRETLGISDLIMKMKFPGLAHPEVMKSIRLFGERVKPGAGL